MILAAGHPSDLHLRNIAGNISSTFQDPVSATSLAFQVEMDVALENFSHETTNMVTLSAMTLGSSAYRFGKLLSSPFLPRIFSSVIGLSLEVTVFEGTQQALSSAHTGNFSESWRNCFFNLGILKGMGFLLHSQNSILQHFSQDLSMVTGNQLTSFLGWTPEAQGGFLNQMLHAEILNNQLAVGNHLAGMLIGNRNHSMEQHLEQSTKLRSIERNGGFRQASPVDAIRMATLLDQASTILPKEELEQRTMLALRGLFEGIPEAKDYLESVAQMVPGLLDLFTPFAPLFPRYPEWTLMACIAFDLCPNTGRERDFEEYQLFVHFLFSRSLASPDYFRSRCREREFSLDIQRLYEDFCASHDYYSKLDEMLKDITLYRVNIMGVPTNGIDLFKNLQRNFVFYLARRLSHSAEDRKTSATKTVERMHEEGLFTSTPEAAAMHQYVDFMTKKMAGDEEFLQTHHLLHSRDFPEARLMWECAQKDPISRSDFDAYLHLSLPRRTPGENPLLVIVGIGPDLELAKSYAQQGYDLLLIDHHESLTRSFEDLIENAQSRYGVQIHFECEDIYAASQNLLTNWARKADAILYANVNDNLEASDSAFILGLLKKNGIFVQCHPMPIHREALVREGNFRVLIHRKWIRAFLGTPSERLAYPTGVHVLVAEQQ